MMTTKDGDMPLDPSGVHDAQQRIIDNLTTTVIAVPLLRMMAQEEKEGLGMPQAFDLIIDLNL